MSFHVSEGMLVVVKDFDYRGLIGYIDRLVVEECETENRPLSEYVVVDCLETNNMEKSHPHLNGTGIDQLIMDKSELIVFPNGASHKGVDVKGKEYIFQDVISAYAKDVVMNILG